MIKAIIFDWAGVLADDGFWVWLRKNITNIEQKKSEYQALSEKVDGGIIPHSDFMDYLSQASGKTADQVWEEVKNEIIINHELINFIRDLKTKYQIALLSNFTYPWLNEIITDNDLWDLFDHHIISSEHKMIKPNPEIFHKMLEMLKIDASEAIFVDDRPKNVEASNNLGIKAFLYTNLGQFKADLANVLVI